MDELIKTAEITHVKCLKKNIFKRMAKEPYWTKSSAKNWLDYNYNAGNIRVFCADREYRPSMIATGSGILWPRQGLDVKPVASIKNDVASIVQNIFKLVK